jgi:tetratricopeptide (TPR) repeat protein
VNTRAVAIRLLIFCLGLAPWSASARSPAGSIASQSEVCAEARGAAPQRIKACTALINRTTDDRVRAGLYNNRGTAFADKGDQKHAFTDYAQAIRLNPGESAAYVNRGDLQFRRGELDRAIEDFDAALRIDPAFERAYIGRTAAYLKTNQGDAALRSADDMIAHEPGSATAVDTRACVLKQIGRRDDAIAEYRKALQMASDIPELRQEIQQDLHELGAAA